MSTERSKSFVLYQNYLNQFRLLSMEERGRLITAIFEYAEGQTILTELSDVAKMAFSCMKDTLDRDREAYMAKCAKNAENGRKGGKAKKNFFCEKSERLETEANQAYNDNDNGNGNGNGNGNENDIDIDIGNGIGNGIENDIEQPNAPLESAPPISAPLSYDPDFAFSTRSAFSEGEKKDKSPLSPADSVHSVPLRAAPPLSTQEKKELFLKGIPADYIAEREERAAEFAYKTKRSTFSVMLEWWEGDKYSAKWNKGKTGISLKGLTDSRDGYEKSYDTDDFFEASLNRAHAAFDAKYGKEGPKSDSENKET